MSLFQDRSLPRPLFLAGGQHPARRVPFLGGLLLVTTTVCPSLLAVAGPQGQAPISPALSPATSPAPIPPPQPTAQRPLRLDPKQWQPASPRRFDQSLDDLVRRGIVTPQEKRRIRTGSTTVPVDPPAHRQACRSGALSAQECSSGVVVRWRGRGNRGGGAAGNNPALARGGRLGAPLTTPLTVPVSALLAGSGGRFSLDRVFAVTPRPARLLGNGNRQLLFPLIGSSLTSSPFGYRLHPILGSWLMHSGRDLAAPEGTPVVAALAGRVVSSGLAGGYGLAIEIEHQQPRRRTLYGHLSELYVKSGEQVQQGEVIGRVGSTGLSTGPHLHFELRQPAQGGWVAVDPGDLDPGSAALGSDAVAMLMGQLLDRLERSPALASRPAAGLVSR